MREGYEYPKVLYRAESCWNPGTLFRDDELEVYYNEYKVVKNTHCGVWIALSGYHQFAVRNGESPKAVGCKWVDLGGRKRFAYPTKEEALESLKIRKIWQRRYAKNALALAEETLKAIKKMQGGEDERKDSDGKADHGSGSGTKRMSILRP